jgi:hypothetical protein
MKENEGKKKLFVVKPLQLFKRMKSHLLEQSLQKEVFSQSNV